MPEVFDAKRDHKKHSAKAAHTHAAHTADTSADTTQDTTHTSPLRHRSVDEYSQVMAEQPPTRNPLNSFAAKPVNTYFDTVNSDETVLLLLRQHPVTQIKWLVVAVFLVFVPFLLSYVNVLGFLPLRFHIVAALAWYLMVIGFSLESFLSWFFNVYIITDERVIDVDFKSLLFKNVSAAKFERIEDINFTTSGTLGAVFDYGTVVIQTAAANEEFEFEHVPHPSRVTAFLNDMLTEIGRQIGRRRVE